MGRRGPHLKDDRLIIELALALQIAWGLSERKAIDLALALMEGRPVEPTKIPRGGKRKPGTLVGYRLREQFRGRSATIRRKIHKPQDFNADPAVTLALATLLMKRRPKNLPKTKT
jgi:hypothetical protein